MAGCISGILDIIDIPQEVKQYLRFVKGVSPWW